MRNEDTEPVYTYSQVVKAANEAADMVTDGLDLPDCGARDVANLVVNALGTLLRELCVLANYEASPGEVRDWCEGIY